MPSKFKKKIAERSTEELTTILQEDKEDYPPEVIGIIEEVLEERGINLEEEQQPETEPEQTRDYERVSSIADRGAPKRTPAGKSESKHRTLQITAGFIKVFSFLFLIAAGVFSFWFAGDSPLYMTAVLFAAVIFVIPYFAFSKLIYLFIELEKNTSRTRELLERVLRKKSTEQQD